MNLKKQKDTTSIIIGILILGFIIWQVISYILPDQPAYENGKALLVDVMKIHGGKNNWDSKKGLSFTKDFKLFKKDGRTEIEKKESHRYNYAPREDLKVAWSQDSNEYVLHKTSKGILQYVNDSIDARATTKTLYAKLNAATFVIDLPYSLDDTNASLDYQGQEDFQGQDCHVLKVNFKDSKDTWWLYFATDNFSWLGYWVHTSNHFSLVLNEEMIDVNGFTLSRKRKSYRTDSLQNITYLRATYDYTDYKIN